MNLNLIHEAYQSEMIGSFEVLADLVRSGVMNSKEFMTAQQAIFNTYRRATIELELARVAG